MAPGPLFRRPCVEHLIEKTLRFKFGTILINGSQDIQIFIKGLVF